jgi:Uma2 family endonuclease
MRVLMIDAPQSMLDDRHRMGLDRRDEMWDGVVHMVPPAKDEHQGVNGDFWYVVYPLAKRRGLFPRMETGLFHCDDDYRVPDQLYRLPEHGSERGAEGAEMVVEVRSPNDDTYRKFDFFIAVDVREVLVLHPKGRRFELFRRFDDRLMLMSPGPSGTVESDVLGIQLATVDGKLRITWAEGSADI